MTTAAPARSGERSVAVFGTTAIPYEIQRSARRSTVSIAVDPAGGVILTAPPSIATPRLDDLVRRKAPWILERRRRKSDVPPALPTRELVSGESYSYLGRQYVLDLARGDVGPIRLVGRRLRLRIPADLGADHVHAYARAALVDWYLARARAILPPRTRRLAARLGIQPAKIVIAEPAKRWGSASKDGILRLNWRIVQAPPALVEYVVAHELVHLVHPNHSAAFWAKLGAVLPDYDARKDRLRALGPLLVW